MSAKHLAVLLLLLLSSSVLALVPAPGASADQGVSRDPGFGENGRVIVGPGDGGSLLYQNMTTQTDGGAVVLIAGGAGGNYLARYNSNGHLDDSFGVHGKVSFSIYNFPVAFRLPTDPSAPIFVVLATITEHEYAVRRYHPDGSPDASFGTAGQLTVLFTGFDNTV